MTHGLGSTFVAVDTGALRFAFLCKMIPSHTASSLLESQYGRSGAGTPCWTFGEPFKITVCSWFSSRCVCSSICRYALAECRLDTFLCPCNTLRWGHTTESLVSFPLAALVLPEVVSSESVRGVCDHCTRSLPSTCSLGSAWHEQLLLSMDLASILPMWGVQYGTAGCLIKPWLLMIQLQVVAGFSFDDLAKHCACVMIFSVWSRDPNVIHNSCSLYSLEHLIHDFTEKFRARTWFQTEDLYHLYLPTGVLNVVSSEEASSSLIWQNPLFATSFENTLASGMVMMTFSVALIGWCSRFMTLFKSLGSIQMRTLSP